jgi:two-component system osmolarity sensor histidine kinase EnvZ
MKWPRTLFGRNLLLLVALLVSSQIAWTIAFRLLVQTPRLERLATYMLEQNDLLRFSLEQLPADDRTRVLETLTATRPERLIAAANAGAWLRAPASRRIEILIAPLSRALGPEHPVRWEPAPGSRLWIRTHLNGEDYWMGFSTAGLVPEASAILLAGCLVTALLSLIGAAVIQRHLHRPLRQLASAATAVAAGETMPPLALGGPREIATVAASFTHMAESLARADAERALMLAGVSHDLRTPLAKLRLCVEMLRAQADAELIDSMTRSIDTADAIIGQFVDFARIGSDEAVQLCDPTELVRSLVDTPGSRQPPALRIGDVPPIRARPVALRRAIANLLENAERYAPGEIVLELAITFRNGEPRLRIAVLDRGPGIPEEQIARARQPFARLNESRGNRPGAGLGLAIVERIARLHGGRLVLESRAGGGLAAAIELPLAAIGHGESNEESTPAR